MSIASWLSAVSLAATPTSSSFHNYFHRYARIAVDQMNEYYIPASITLAQGVLESGAGEGRLAVEANNHFGIKCHNDWDGKRIYHDDNKQNECFRSYRTASDSYEDHSLFLSERSRYQSLFALQTTDYRGWAEGLQRAGYATDPAYARKLIKIIEEYQLYRYDKELTKRTKTKSNEADAITRPVYRNTNDMLYVHAYQGETVEAIASELGFKARLLTSYNELPKACTLDEGAIVYLEKKKRRADKTMPSTHIIKPGETMHSIAQLYGVTLRYLYKRNKLRKEYTAQLGDTLLIGK